MKQKECVLITAADKNYLEQAKQLFSSVYYNSGWPGDYMLLSYDIPEKDLKWFRDKGIIVRKVKSYNSLCRYTNKDILRSERSWRWNSIALFKLNVFDVYFKRWKNVVFLDSDTLVRASLDKLAHVKGLWAVQDHLPLLKQQFSIGGPKDIKNRMEKAYCLKTPAFNSGVMAFDTAMIKINTLRELRNLFQEYKEINLWGDQGILNLYFYKRWKKLSTAYNFYAPLYDEEIVPTIIIYHDVGSIKKWSKNPFHKECKENLEKAEFIDLKNRPAGKIRLSQKLASSILTVRIIRFIIKYLIKRTDKNIGLIGIKIKKISPKAYLILKKLFPNKK